MNILAFDFRIDWVTTVLDSLESAFQPIGERGSDQPWFDGLFQMEHAEAVFGVAFVIAQAYILGTSQDVNGIRKSAKKTIVLIYTSFYFLLSSK